MEVFKVKFKFLHCKNPKKIIEKMYPNTFRNEDYPNNQTKYLSFFDRVEKDKRWDELEELLNAMTRKEQIRNAADEHFAHSWSGSVKDAFAEGAQWADKIPFPNFISVKDRLPELRENVLVFGVVDVNIPVFNSDGERIYHSNKVFDVWFNKRTEPSEHTDGNGFLLLKSHEGYKITHWFPLPKLDGKELYERI